MNAPVQVEYRAVSQKAALVFVHGFSGNTAETWGLFPDLLKQDPRLKSWGLYALGYASSLRIDVPGLWAADASIATLALSFAAALSVPPFDKCEVIGIAAHSMGGLIVQRAILDNPSLRKRLSHLFLFGTPSGGLYKAWFGALLKRQTADMRAGGPFIRALRADWLALFDAGTPFVLKAIGGERDEFVPPRSSLRPFPDASHAIVPGNHIQIVKPDDAGHRSVLLVAQGLCTGGSGVGVYDSARLQVELRQFAAAAKTLLPNAGALDPDGLVALALALEGLGRGPEALQVLEAHYRGGGTTSTDALGVLAGRIKRRWLAGRLAADWARSRQLYTDGLDAAEKSSDYGQAYYHAINIAFLDLMATAAAADVPAAVKVMAQRALDHCAKATDNNWRRATEAEAALMMQRLPEATARYGRALEKTTSERERDSMYGQAARVAARVFGEDGVTAIEDLFGFARPEPRLAG